MPQKIRSKNTDFGLDTDAIKVPVGTNNQRETVETGALRFNSTTGKLEVFDGTSYKSVGIEAPVIDSISPTNVSLLDGTGNVTFTITGSNFTSGSNAVLLTSQNAQVSFSSVTRINDTELQCTIALSSLSNDGEPYGVKVTNGQNTFATLTGQINVDAQPVFITSAGSLGVFNDDQRTGISLTVVATDPESAGTVTYELISGSLPSGLSGSDSSGVFTISGNADSVVSDTTSTFTIRAKDAASNTSTRQFTIRINAVKLATFNSPGTFTVPTGVTSVEVLAIAGGGNATGGGGGGGAGGLVYSTSFPVTPGASIPVSIGSGGSGNLPAPGGWTRGAPGTNTTFSTITALGGGGGGGGAGTPGLSGGSGGGAGGEGGSPGSYSGSPATQGPSGGAPGFGNPGGGGLGNTGNSPNQGGGGGGAGTAGGPSNAVQSARGQGGDGRTYSISGSPVGYAGGSGGPQTSTAFGFEVSTGVATSNRGAGGSGTGAPGVVIIAWT